MSLTIDLAPEVEARLKEESARYGVDPGEYARRLIENGLPSTRHPISLLIDQWNQEDATDDAEEIARRQAEWEELKNAMNETRRLNGEEPLVP